MRGLRVGDDLGDQHTPREAIPVLLLHLSPAPWNDYDKTLYVLEAEKHPRLDVTSVAERIRGFQARYELDAIVIDGANKQAVEEMRRRHDLPLRAADKTGKSDFIEIRGVHPGPDQAPRAPLQPVGGRVRRPDLGRALTEA